MEVSGSQVGYGYFFQEDKPYSRGAACSNSRPPPSPPPPSRATKVFEPVFLQFEIFGKALPPKAVELIIFQ